ncbi:MAG: hypothetical protein ACKVIK_04095 [Rhodospirillales bacterium]
MAATARDPFIPDFIKIPVTRRFTISEEASTLFVAKRLKIAPSN